MTSTSTTTARVPHHHHAASSFNCQMTQKFIARKAREQLEDVLLGLQLDLELLQQEQQQSQQSSSDSNPSGSDPADVVATIDALTKIKALVKLCKNNIAQLTNPVTGDTALHSACRFRYKNNDIGNETVAELQSSMIQIVHYFIQLFSTTAKQLSLENHAGQTPHDLAVTAGNAPPELLQCLQQLRTGETTTTNDESSNTNSKKNGKEKKKSSNKSSSSNKKESTSNDSADMASLFHSVFGRFSSGKKKNKVGIVPQQQPPKKEQNKHSKAALSSSSSSSSSKLQYHYDEHGNSLIHKVFLVCRDCHKGQPPALNVVESIVQHNPDALLHANHASETPLSLALQCAAAASLPLIQYLVESSSSFSPLGRLYPRDTTIWHLLCANARYISVEVVDYLLRVTSSSSARPKQLLDKRNWDRDTPLHVACQTLFSGATSTCSIETASQIIRLLVKANPRALSKTNGLYETPLHALLSNSQSCRRQGGPRQQQQQQHRGQQQHNRIHVVPLQLIRTVVEAFPPALLYSYYFDDLPVFAAAVAADNNNDDNDEEHTKKLQYLQQATRAAAQALIESLTLYENRNTNNNNNQTTTTTTTKESAAACEVTTIVHQAKANAESLLERLSNYENAAGSSGSHNRKQKHTSFAEMYDIHAQVISCTITTTTTTTMSQQQQHARLTGAFDETEVGDSTSSSGQWDDNEYIIRPVPQQDGQQVFFPQQQHQQPTNHWDHDVWTWMRQRGSSKATNLLSTLFRMNQAGRSYYKNDPSNVIQGVHVLEQARSTNNVTGLYRHVRENPVLCCCASASSSASGATTSAAV